MVQAPYVAVFAGERTRAWLHLRRQRLGGGT